MAGRKKVKRLRARKEELEFRISRTLQANESLRMGECLDTIPNTFIMCGEGDNYCSAACRLLAALRKAIIEGLHFRSAYESLLEHLDEKIKVEES